ncbi:MAG: PVC-type heme-binding CxxCH protein [Planctomycetota bacterium]|nr:PVC-type heme-binding CxxCH protein [Planctomycetota bacterium]
MLLTTSVLAPSQVPTGIRIDGKNPLAPKTVQAVETGLPLALRDGDRVVFIGNTLFDRAQHFAYFEAMIHQAHAQKNLTVRTLAWSADEIDLAPRPANFGSLHQHLTVQQADVIIAAYGFNESFKGTVGLDDFKQRLTRFLNDLKTKAFNAKTGPRIVLVSPIANEDVASVAAGQRNNANLQRYTTAMQEVAKDQAIAFIDVFAPTRAAMKDPATDLTFNGVHLLDNGYRELSATLFRIIFGRTAPTPEPEVRKAVLDKNRQFQYRYRPLNTFYYVGGRKGSYGEGDFIPAMRRFDTMLQNRDRRIHAIAQGEPVPAAIDDSNAPALTPTRQSRHANRWMSQKDELAAFKVDPRFDVQCFASEEDFPDLACPVQMRWDASGRLWVSCTTTYPHVYPGNSPRDKILVLEDTNGDGKADKSSVFADDLHIPLSFEFGDGGLYVSEPPDLTLIKDTDGDGRADFRRRLLTGFGTEDSHHSLHDIVWTPDGDLLARDSIFLHSQVETPYGPVRLFDSGWFRFQPSNHRLIAFGMYRSTNPWGVTFDDWGQHVASHPIFASAFHARNPTYPKLHPNPRGLPAYSGTCGQEFIDMASFPAELQGCFVKARYKPTNRIEIHSWLDKGDHYAEKYQGDLLFSSNLSFIPVDIRFGPRGALYVLDWYNPVKGHSQYSLRDTRRDRKSGRIWRITAKGRNLLTPPKIAGQPIPALLRLLERREYRYRYWAKRELRERDPKATKRALDAWVKSLDPKAPRFRHHQLEAVWQNRDLGTVDAGLLRVLLECDNHHARAAATRQLRYWNEHLEDGTRLLAAAAKDANGLVRLEAAIAASYIGTPSVLAAAVSILESKRGKHLNYALACALGSEALRPLWEKGPERPRIEQFLTSFQKGRRFSESTANARDAQFDGQKNLKTIKISCVAEKMKFTVERFEVKPRQPVKVVFTNSDATDHNIVFVRPGKAEAVGIAAAVMAQDPKNANSDFVPKSKSRLILHASKMIGPTRKSKIDVMRFRAPNKPGVYPYICTFPGHFTIMKGEMVVRRKR